MVKSLFTSYKLCAMKELIMDRQRKFDLLGFSSLNNEACPSADDLAAYVLDMLSANDALRVAAHVRTCPLCTADVRASRPPPPKRKPILAQLLPLALLSTRDTIQSATRTRQYAAADIQVDLTIPPAEGDAWEIAGQVLRAGSGVQNCEVELQAGRRRYHQFTDEQGFFQFEALPANTYVLKMIDSNVTLEIKDLILKH